MRICQKSCEGVTSDLVDLAGRPQASRYPSLAEPEALPTELLPLAEGRGIIVQAEVGWHETPEAVSLHYPSPV